MYSISPQLEAGGVLRARKNKPLAHRIPRTYACGRYRKDLERQVEETKARRKHEDMNDTEFKLNSDIVKRLEADKRMVRDAATISLCLSALWTKLKCEPLDHSSHSSHCDQVV